jgi:hypothetical protein
MEAEPLPLLRAPGIYPPEHGSSSAAPLPGSTGERSGSTDTLTVTNIRAVVRGPSAAGEPGRWSQVVVGWLPGDGWFCDGCQRGRGCAHVDAVRGLAVSGGTDSSGAPS